MHLLLPTSSHPLSPNPDPSPTSRLLPPTSSLPPPTSPLLPPTSSLPSPPSHLLSPTFELPTHSPPGLDIELDMLSSQLRGQFGGGTGKAAGLFSRFRRSTAKDAHAGGGQGDGGLGGGGQGKLPEVSDKLSAASESSHKFAEASGSDGSGGGGGGSGGSFLETYVDGGVLNNYPIDAFDGWWLSMDAEDTFFKKVSAVSLHRDTQPSAPPFFTFTRREEASLSMRFHAYPSLCTEHPRPLLPSLFLATSHSLLPPLSLSLSAVPSDHRQGRARELCAAILRRRGPRRGQEPHDGLSPQVQCRARRDALAAGE